MAKIQQVECGQCQSIVYPANTMIVKGEKICNRCFYEDLINKIDLLIEEMEKNGRSTEMQTRLFGSQRKTVAKNAGGRSATVRQGQGITGNVPNPPV